MLRGAPMITESPLNPPCQLQLESSANLCQTVKRYYVSCLFCRLCFIFYLTYFFFLHFLVSKNIGMRSWNHISGISGFLRIEIKGQFPRFQSRSSGTGLRFSIRPRPDSQHATRVSSHFKRYRLESPQSGDTKVKKYKKKGKKATLQLQISGCSVTSIEGHCLAGLLTA